MLQVVVVASHLRHTTLQMAPSTLRVKVTRFKTLSGRRCCARSAIRGKEVGWEFHYTTLCIVTVASLCAPNIMFRIRSCVFVLSRRGGGGRMMRKRDCFFVRCCTAAMCLLEGGGYYS